MEETFIEFLMGKCEEDTHALDDDLPDAYNDWVVAQDPEDIIDWAETWHKEQLAAQDRIHLIRKRLEELRSSRGVVKN